MRAEEFLNEAGEPENPSRRGFLRGLAGAAATAAMPGGVANLVKTAPAAAPAAAAATASVADLLFQTALAIGSDHGFSKSSSWFDDEEDSEEDEWDETLEEPQGQYGEMPWGEYYEMGETPNGVPYLHTSDSPDGTFGVFTFMDGGKPQYILIAWERGGFSEVQDASDEKYIERWHNVEDNFEGDPAEIIDAIVNPANDAPARVTQTSNVASGGVTNKETKLYTLRNKATGEDIGYIQAVNDEDAIKDFLGFSDNKNFDLKDYNLVATDGWVNGKVKNPRVVDIPAAGPGPMDLARLAGIAGKAADATKQPATPTQTQQPAQAALPAPTAPNVLEPELNKQKQKVPVNKNASR